MIENTRKILRKLIDNIEKYQVRCNRFGSDYYHIYFTTDRTYHINITENYIRWDAEVGIGIGSHIETLLDEQFRYEILDLCVKLKNRCEDHISTIFRKFADESDNEPDDDLE